MRRIRIAIVNSKSFGEYSSAVEELRRIGDVSRISVPSDASGGELASRLDGFHFVIASVTPYYGREFFEGNRSVVMIVRHGVGLDNVDLEAAEEHGVAVARVPGRIEREAVAEHAITLMLLALRKTYQAIEAVRRGGWRARSRFVGWELGSRVVGVIGFGNIGSRVAEILVRGFGSKVLAYDPYVPEERIKSVGAIPADLEELLASSDVISLHAKLTKENYHMLDEQAFRRMKDGVIIVNTSRGELISVQALAKALAEGKVSAAALDVVEGEPIDESHPLLEFENVIITPHIAAYTREALKGMDEFAVRAITAYLEGEPVEGLVVAPTKPRKIL